MSNRFPSSHMTLPFSELSGFAPLFRTYVTNYEALSGYFGGNPADDTDVQDLVQRTVTHPRDRDNLVLALHRQAELFHADVASRSNIDQLQHPEAAVIVTGQQLGLAGGPLYTLYKTITTIQLARKLTKKTGKPVVPVFWLESEDHDLPEAAYLNIPSQTELNKIAYTGHILPEKGNLGPVGRIAFSEQINEVLAEVEAALMPTDFRAELMALIRSEYLPGATFCVAFARLLCKLFAGTGLVMISPDDPALKTLSIPLFQKAIQEKDSLYQALSTTSNELLAAGFHAQVAPRLVNLFYVHEGTRYAIEPVESGYQLKGHHRTFTEEELLAEIAAHPTCFSPNVVLRPQMQDFLLPTAVYVGGPGEVAYFAQFKKVYEWSGTPMPIIFPRASATLMEPRVRKIVDRNQLHWPDLAGNVDTYFQNLVKRFSNGKMDAVFDSTLQVLATEMDQLKPLVIAQDGSLDRAVEATRTNLFNELEKLRKRVLQAEKRNYDALRDQVWKARLALFPDGLQERNVSFLYFLNKYGTDLITLLLDKLDVETQAHQVIEL